MSVRSDNVTDDPRVRFGLWVAGIAALLCIIGWFMQSAPTQPGLNLPPDPFTEPQKAMARYRDMARQTGGDWNRVSQTDQMILNKMTSGHGKEYFAMLVHEPKTASPLPSATP